MAFADKTALCNVALSHLGHSKALTDVDTDATAESLACLVHYDTALRSMLEDYPWPFATKFSSALTLVSDSPNSVWDHSYTLPADCLQVQSLHLGDDPEHYHNDLPHDIIEGASARELHCNLGSTTDGPIIRYTSTLVTPARFSNSFGYAFTYLLASLVAPSITRAANMAPQMFQLYDLWSERAKAHADAERRVYPEPASPLERARW